MPVTETLPEADTEAAIHRIGLRLSSALRDDNSSPFEPRWWDDELLREAVQDTAARMQMFRFVELLPALKSHAQIAGVLDELYRETKQIFPDARPLARTTAANNQIVARMVAVAAQNKVRRIANRFVGGNSAEEIGGNAAQVWSNGSAVAVAPIHTTALGDSAANDALAQCRKLVKSLAVRSEQWPADDLLDGDALHELPRVWISLPLGALRPSLSHAAGGDKKWADRCRKLLHAGVEHGCGIHWDAGPTSSHQSEMRLLDELLGEPDFAEWPHVAVTLPAYWTTAAAIGESLLSFAQSRGTPLTVCLIEGDRRERELAAAAQSHRASPLLDAASAGRSFEQLTRYLMENREWLRPRIATQNLRQMAFAITCAVQVQATSSEWELQLTYGLCKSLPQVLSREGVRVVTRIPTGPAMQTLSALVRGYLENPSNDLTLRHVFGDHDPEELLMPAEESTTATAPSAVAYEEFEPLPVPQWDDSSARDLMAEALKEVAGDLGGDYPLIIKGRAVDSGATFTSRGPADKTAAIGTVASATHDTAEQAIEAARQALPFWSREKVNYRCEYLELIGDGIEQRRYELAAWAVLECGLPWDAAHADVTAAVNFFKGYALRMRQLEQHHALSPGAARTFLLAPCGVVFISTPSMSPLGCLAGFAAAALATGNTIVMKPARHAAVTAAQLMDIITGSHVPDGVVNFLPGVGDEIGHEIAGHPDVDMVAFAGSHAVGLQVHEQSAVADERRRHVERSFVHTAGENVAVIDGTGDLDDAVTAIVNSACLTAGQRATACGRVIVVKKVHDEFVEKLTAALKSVKVGKPDDPATVVGPLFTEDGLTELQARLEFAEECGTVTLTSKAPKKGNYLAPHLITDVEADSAFLRNHIPGPLITVLAAKSFDDALKIAEQSGTNYTMSVFSRGPGNLQKAATGFAAEHIFLNCPPDALLDSHPFGHTTWDATAMREDLQLFLRRVSVTENTLRRGAAPK